MKKRLFLTALVILPSALLAQEQQYKSAILYNAEGPVKEIKLNTPDKRMQVYSTQKFTEEGLMNNGIMYYSENGLPLGATSTDGSGVFMSYDISYNEINLPESIILVSGKKPELKFDYSYEGGRRTQCKVTPDTGRPDDYILYTYSDEKYDAHGNWISRHVCSTSVKEGASSENTEYDETRSITYRE